MTKLPSALLAASLGLLGGATTSALPCARPSLPPLGTAPSLGTLLGTFARSAANAAADGEIERLTAWPELADEAAAKREVARLRAAGTPEMASSAAARIREEGAAFAPLLLGALGKERDDEARARVVDALTSITSEAHTRLLAEEWSHKSEHVRAFALARVAALRDPGLEAKARAHYVALEERAADPAARTAPSPEELDLAARAALASGALVGMERCLAQAEANWKLNGPALRVAARGVRGDAATAYLVPKLVEAGSDAGRVAALNLLAAAGSQEAVFTVRRFLEVEANPVRVAAINALRGIVDDAPPLENLSVFTAIEEAKRWKERT